MLLCDNKFLREGGDFGNLYCEKCTKIMVNRELKGLKFKNE